MISRLELIASMHVYLCSSCSRWYLRCSISSFLLFSLIYTSVRNFVIIIYLFTSCVQHKCTTKFVVCELYLHVNMYTILVGAILVPSWQSPSVWRWLRSPLFPLQPPFPQSVSHALGLTETVHVSQQQQNCMYVIN